MCTRPVCRYWSQFANANNTAEAVFTQLYAYHQSLGLTVGSYQLDPWWYSLGNCGNWTANPTLFPRGLQPLLDLGMRFTLYSSYFTADPSQQQMPGYDWVNSTDINVGWLEGYIATPGADASEPFYSMLLDRCVQWGCNAFEVDFMDVSGC